MSIIRSRLGEPAIVQIDVLVTGIEESESFHLRRGVSNEGLVDITKETIPAVEKSKTRKSYMR